MKLNTFKISAGALLLSVLSLTAAAPADAQGYRVRPQVDLPEGPIRNVILQNCVMCHGIDEYAFRSHDRQTWDTLLDELHDPYVGSGSTLISDNDREILLDYLVENFGPDYIEFPREYVAPEITEFFANPEARVFLDRNCTECHELRVFDRRHTPARWRAIVVDMRERGAELSDENMEKLVEWLGRVRGTNPFE